MNWLITYNKHFKTILIKTSNKDGNKISQEENVTLVYLDEELVAINILNVYLDDKVSKTELQKIAFEKISHLVDVSNVNVSPQFICVKVVECNKIPDTHLSLCKVNTGTEIVQVVCGAENVKKDMKTILAKVGSWMPNGLYIQQNKLRGNDSFGMLCSARELNILDKFNSTGIIKLSNLTKLGKSVWEI
ncbi:YtpR family tRNA-binding protein [Spiroplasma endosymbiont of Othius punctulatus]|uniref:YtpR family tRNA-binding protein n=1 Tax=Spiroplasma endosymbiont of Othius punctulatus TaxID=3066289 RepID=UPI0030D2162A